MLEEDSVQTDAEEVDWDEPVGILCSAPWNKFVEKKPVIQIEQFRNN